MARKGDRATHCKNGHEFTPENTVIVKRSNRWGSNYQRCRTCEAAQRKTPKVRAYMKDYQRAYRVGRHGELAATKAEVSEMLVSQDGLCAICYEEPATDLDHDHATGELRGMLCKRCNLALGLFDDDPERLRFAAEYVTTPRIQEVV